MSISVLKTLSFEPSLFLVYINYLPESFNAKVRLLADDTIVYFTVNPSSNSQTLQTDDPRLSNRGSG